MSEERARYLVERERADRAEYIDNLVGKLYRERDTQATELADKETDLQQARVERDDLSYKLRASTIQRDGLRTALDATSKLANDSLTELDQLRPKLAKAETEKGTLREALEAACELAEDMMLLLCLTTRAGKWIAELERLEGIAKQTKGE